MMYLRNADQELTSSGLSWEGRVADRRDGGR